MALTIDNLQIQIDANAEKASSGIMDLTTSLELLKSLVGDSAGLVTQLKELSGAIRSFTGIKLNLTSTVGQLGKLGDLIPTLGGAGATQMSQNLRDISSALTSFTNVPKISLTSVANGITALNTAAASFDAARLTQFSQQMRGIASGLAELNAIQKGNLGSVINQLRKIPEVTKALDPATIDAFSAAIKKLVAALAPLAAQMETIYKAFSILPARMRSVIRASNQTASSTGRLSKSYYGLGSSLARTFARFWTLYYTMQRVINIFADAFNTSSEYIEALNLFKVSMGDAADAAYDYAETVKELMGIDVAEWITNQGVFQRMATGFGISADQAEIMSQNLTQLAYDMSSFFNTDVETAMDKLQSGMSGQIKGLKAWGYNLSVAALQETALSLGIEQSVRTMTEAQKAQLRYITLIQRSNGIMGDMAKTLTTPANAMRILNAQLVQLERAFGDVISVLLVKVIPYVQAFVELMTEAANTLAKAMGFEIKELPSNNLEMAEDVIEGIGDEADDTLETVEELKKQLMGFDELNILKNPKDSSDDKDISYDLGLDLPEYDFLLGVETIDLDVIKEKLKGILEIVGLIGTGLLAWEISKDVVGLVSAIQSGGFNKVAMGVTIMVTGLSLEFSGAYDLGYEGANFKNILKTALGAALGVAGSLLIFGTGPVGWTVGIATAIIVGVTGFSLGYEKKKLEEDLAAHFGELVLDVEEIAEMSEDLTTSELSLKLDVFVDEVTVLSNLQGQIENTIKELKKYNYRIDLGIEVNESEYKAAVDSFVDGALEYINQKQIVASIAIEILYGDSAEGNRLQNFTSTYYGATSEELYKLGSDLKKVVSDGFVDGKWIDDSYEQALELQKEIQEILDYISTVEFEAKLTALRLDVSDLSPESFTGILEEAQTTIAGQMEHLESVRLEALKLAQMEYDTNIKSGMAEDAAKQLYDEAVAAAQSAFNQGRLELNYGTVDFGLDVLLDAYKEELKGAAPAFEAAKNYLSGVNDDYPNPEAARINAFYAISNSLIQSDLPPETRKNLAELIEQLSPSLEEYEKVAADARALGESVPKEISEGLRNAALLKALGNDVEGIHFLVGEAFSTDPAFFEALAKSEEAGAQLTGAYATGFALNLEVLEDAASGAVTFLKDGVEIATVEATPELVGTLEKLGYNLSEGLLAGAETGMEETKKSWLDWAIWPWNWFKEKNEINSPSKLFYRGGQDIIQGLWNGLEDLWKQLTSWWEGLSLGDIDLKTPHFEWTTEPATGFIGKTLEALGLPASLPKLNVEWYASGGFPATGEMFIAREMGPELVGRIGNKNAVANNEQITTAIASAVYNAMMAAQGGNGGGQTARIVVQIGERVVGEAAVEYINGQIVQTGVSPIYS